MGFMEKFGSKKEKPTFNNQAISDAIGFPHKTGESKREFTCIEAIQQIASLAIGMMLLNRALPEDEHLPKKDIIEPLAAAIAEYNYAREGDTNKAGAKVAAEAIYDRFETLLDGVKLAKGKSSERA